MKAGPFGPAFFVFGVYDRKMKIGIDGRF
ncbi:hypothetical protein QF005_004923, partial [Pseudomonas sp. PvP006]|nr:hypothetical protein [Pseudomonas sp. PvP006]